MSLALTDHYLDKPTLEQIGAAIRAGKMPKLDPQMHAMLTESLRKSGKLDELLDPQRYAQPSDSTFQANLREFSADGTTPPAKKRWWKFW
jgi:hypothetical protein